MSGSGNDGWVSLVASAGMCGGREVLEVYGSESGKEEEEDKGNVK